MKRVAVDFVSRFLDRHGIADPLWVHMIEIPGDKQFPTLQLPGDWIRYSTKRAFPISLEPRLADRPLLFVQFESFDIAAHAANNVDWAIPLAYEPQNDAERFRQELGFDEGWEDAELECMFACDERFAAFWRAALERKRFGLTVPGAESLYPVRLGERELDPLTEFLAAIPSA